MLDLGTVGVDPEINIASRPSALATPQIGADTPAPPGSAATNDVDSSLILIRNPLDCSCFLCRKRPAARRYEISNFADGETCQLVNNQLKTVLQGSAIRPESQAAPPFVIHFALEHPPLQVRVHQPWLAGARLIERLLHLGDELLPIFEISLQLCLEFTISSSLVVRAVVSAHYWALVLAPRLLLGGELFEFLCSVGLGRRLGNELSEPVQHPVDGSEGGGWPTGVTQPRP